MNKKIKKPMAFIAVAAALMCLSMAVYGQELISIVKTVTLGNHAEFQVIKSNSNYEPIHAEIKGMVFDKDGNELEIYPEDGMLYNANGEEVILNYDDVDGKFRILTNSEYQKMMETEESSFFTTFDMEEGKGYFLCDTLSPEYLPTGYKFDRIMFYGDPRIQKNIDESVQKYMVVYYSNGDHDIVCHLRFMDEETAFTASSTKEVKEIKINGYKAVTDIGSLNIQIGDVLYTFYNIENNDNISIDELVKMAESLK